jgi:hypothetical protein
MRRVADSDSSHRSATGRRHSATGRSSSASGRSRSATGRSCSATTCSCSATSSRGCSCGQLRSGQSRLALVSIKEKYQITCAGRRWCFTNMQEGSDFAHWRRCCTNMQEGGDFAHWRRCRTDMKRVEAGRSLETEPPLVWALRRSSHRFGPPPCRSEPGEVERQGGLARWGGEV